MNEYDKMVLDTAMQAGNILLKSGAEIYRVEETMQRIANYYGVRCSNSFVLSSGIFLTAINSENHMYAQVRHIPLSSVHLERVGMVNQLSREIEEGRYTIWEAQECLDRIEKEKGKKDMTRLAASGLGAGCFCHLAGGGLIDSAAAFISGFLIYFFILWIEKREKATSKIVVNIIGGFLAAVLAGIFYLTGVGSNLSYISVGAIMPLLPGVSFVISIRELAEGNYIGGAVRMLDALLVTLGIAIGVGIAYLILGKVGGKSLG